MKCTKNPNYKAGAKEKKKADCQGSRQGSRVVKAKKAFPCSNNIIKEVDILLIIVAFIWR